jgi:acyl-coenzyme A thioesterase PaaI-like protein
MEEVTYDNRCFGCGALNPEGLQMRFTQVGEGVSEAEYEVPARYQSWAGVVHGGMVALMLDEAVGWAAWHAGHPGLTGKLEVRYRLPLRVGEVVKVVGRLNEHRRTLLRCTAHIERVVDGARVAEASATLMEVPVERIE